MQHLTLLKPIPPHFFHNLKGYDSHLILRAAADIVDKSKLSAIPQSMEKFMCFNIGNLKFLDTAQFMADSLDVVREQMLLYFPSFQN